MRIVIAEKYQHLRAKLRDIESLSAQGDIIYQARNQVLCYQLADGFKLSIKAFKIPNIINQLAYSTIRKSKAERSFIYAQQLLNNKFLTPEPICFVENHSGLLLKESYYVCKHENFDGILRELESNSFESQKHLIESFALYTAKLHEAGIVHIDYSPGNILYKKTNLGYDFYLVDLNRMRFDKQVTAEIACRNFRRLWGNDQKLLYFVEIYAKTRNFEVAKCQEYFLKEAAEFWKTHGVRPGSISQN